mgnify:CR=1 FL=1
MRVSKEQEVKEKMTPGLWSIKMNRRPKMQQINRCSLGAATEHYSAKKKQECVNNKVNGNITLIIYVPLSFEGIQSKNARISEPMTTTKKTCLLNFSFSRRQLALDF